MFILELRVILFVLLFALAAVTILAVWIDRRFVRERRSLIVSPSDSISESRTRPFLNDLAHELRTPLAVLLTPLEIQRSGTVPLETKQESIRLMQAEARRMSRMVSGILELAELETRGLTIQRPVDLRALAAETVVELQPFAQEREISLTLAAEEGAMWVNGDSFHLKQVLLNLTENAIKYSRAHDRIEISIQSDTVAKKIKCQVSDTGPGIAAEHLPHLTRRFYRAASEEISGSGLGLALVAAILQLHDSALEIETTTQGDTTGTCMRFTLDAAPEMEQTV
jgi:two-component system phosphate regulon sensor histidine kinase PhoR